eukprot:Gb_08322 [translate_table: standard]
MWRKITTLAAPVRVAFGYGGTTTGRAAAGFAKGGGGGGGGSGGGGSSFRGADKKPSVEDGIEGRILIHDKTGKPMKEYVEPLDYSTYYPITLPLRKPYSGKSELLDEEEFGEGSANTFDEDSVVPAQELGLRNESEEDKLLFFQLPSSLPLGKLPVAKTEKAPETSSSANGKSGNSSVDNTASSSDAKSASSEGSSILKDIPTGFMGKLLVYESGAVKMQLGDILFDAVPGADCIFAQDVAAVNSVTKHCCFLGEMNKRVILVPDVDSLLCNTLEIGFLDQSKSSSWDVGIAAYNGIGDVERNLLGHLYEDVGVPL